MSTLPLPCLGGLHLRPPYSPGCGLSPANRGLSLTACAPPPPAQIPTPLHLAPPPLPVRSCGARPWRRWRASRAQRTAPWCARTRASSATSSPSRQVSLPKAAAGSHRLSVLLQSAADGSGSAPPSLPAAHLTDSGNNGVRQCAEPLGLLLFTSMSGSSIYPPHPRPARCSERAGPHEHRFAARQASLPRLHRHSSCHPLDLCLDSGELKVKSGHQARPSALEGWEARVTRYASGLSHGPRPAERQRVGCASQQSSSRSALQRPCDCPAQRGWPGRGAQQSTLGTFSLCKRALLPCANHLQVRFHLPVWLGVGEALSKMIEAGKLELLQVGGVCNIPSRTLATHLRSGGAGAHGGPVAPTLSTVRASAGRASQPACARVSLRFAALRAPMPALGRMPLAQAGAGLAHTPQRHPHPRPPPAGHVRQLDVLPRDPGHAGDGVCQGGPPRRQDVSRREGRRLLRLWRRAVRAPASAALAWLDLQKVGAQCSPTPEPPLHAGREPWPVPRPCLQV